MLNWYLPNDMALVLPDYKREPNVSVRASLLKVYKAVLLWASGNAGWEEFERKFQDLAVRAQVRETEGRKVKKGLLLSSLCCGRGLSLMGDPLRSPVECPPKWSP